SSYGRRHTRFSRDWSTDVCSSDLGLREGFRGGGGARRIHLVRRAQARGARPRFPERGDQRGIVGKAVIVARLDAARLEEAFGEGERQSVVEGESSCIRTE